MPKTGNARFQRLHAFLGELYGQSVETHGHLSLQANTVSLSAIDDIKAAFSKAAKYIHGKKGFTADDLKQPEVQELIESNFKTFSKAVETGIKQEIAPSTMNALRKNIFVFSGMKTYTSLREVGSLDFTDKTGKPVSWHEFRKQADELNVKYNEHYLQTEYQFATRSAENVSKWEQLEDDSMLQYRTALDDKVRDSHAEMEGITLPASDKFWDENYPPNGWNCRCVAVEVRAGKYPVSDSKDAFDKGRKSSTQISKDGKNKAAIFRFNPGKQKKIFPDGHPYTSGNCGELKATWTRLAAKIGTKAASAYLANEGDKCKAKKIINDIGLQREYTIETVGKGTVAVHQNVTEANSDYQNVKIAADHFAKEGSEVIMHPKFDSINNEDYQKIYASLKGTPYWGKCPDLWVEGKWYEHEGFVSEKGQYEHMLKRGLKQSARVIMEKTEQTDRHLRKLIKFRINEGQKIDEIWIKDKDNLTLFYKNPTAS